MSMPFYVSPEQLMKDKADYARKGIARGRSVVVLQYDRGIAFVAENPQSLRKISEIYDRIAFAAVGMYYEFENLRVAGIRYADLRGYSYDRSDVTARGLANAYAQTLGTVFTQEPKPYEIEICVAEVGRSAEQDQIYRLTYDGSVSDQHGAMVMGGASAAAEEWIKARWSAGLSLADALALAVSALAADPAGGPSRVLSPSQLEVAVLDRHRPRRTFRRIVGPLLVDLLNADSPTAHAPEADEGIPGHPDILSSAVDPSAAEGPPSDRVTIERDPRVPPPSDERGPTSSDRVETGDDPT
ncbi:MAG TPA: proteasome subunit alpha [Dermatophilaceae bacterium]|nr:proteasome subunit alpha [Dermatophilaceae bacterium]HMT88670.1 proteasome subunit alpha [Dermatophilaceae bacterium]